MKGVIFNQLSDMVEENFGLEVWDEILQKTGQEGTYVSTESYPDEMLFKLVSCASELSGITVNNLVKQFGEFMFPQFVNDYPTFFRNGITLKDFLLSVDRVIHVEVKKLHPDANLPKFEYTDEHDDELTMIYTSPRKLCMLAEGLIAGAANHFSEEYLLEHDICMHDGSDHCRLHIKFLKNHG